MPKVGQEPERRAALVSATIGEVGRTGSLDVTVGQIARSAGMSTALVHYYFESKNALFLAAMRHIMSEFGTSVRRRLKKAKTPKRRLDAIVDASFGRDQFQEHVVSAWLAFYAEAQRSPDAARLLRIYAARLHSNLVHELRQIVAMGAAQLIARGAAAMIDGIYIRRAVFDGNAEYKDAGFLVKEYLDVMVANATARTGAAV